MDVDDAHTRAASTLDPAPCAAIIDLPAEIDDRQLALIRASKIFSAGDLKTPPQTTMQKHLQVASEIFSAGALGSDGGGDLETPPQTTKQKNGQVASEIFSAGALGSDGGGDLETPPQTTTQKNQSRHPRFFLQGPWAPTAAVT